MAVLFVLIRLFLLDLLTYPIVKDHQGRQHDDVHQIEPPVDLKYDNGEVDLHMIIQRYSIKDPPHVLPFIAKIHPTVLYTVLKSLNILQIRLDGINFSLLAFNISFGGSIYVLVFLIGSIELLHIFLHDFGMFMPFWDHLCSIN